MVCRRGRRHRSGTLGEPAWPPKENDDALGRPPAASRTTAPYFAPLNSRRRFGGEARDFGTGRQPRLLFATLGGGQLSEIHNATNSKRTESPRFVVLLHGDACTVRIKCAALNKLWRSGQASWHGCLFRRREGRRRLESPAGE
ncbi:hypothetical protein MTO96_011549 [Rhipicephalus appendiculatus]